MSISALVMLGTVVLLGAGIWFGLRDTIGSHKNYPTAHGKVLGNCGDTMELEFAIVGNRITKVLCASDGCGISQRCIEAAAQLCRGKTVPELETINMMHIMEITGDLPDDHAHCAQLAETTIQYALKSSRSGKSEIAKGL